MKVSKPIYMTIRVDIEYDDTDMTSTEAIDTAVSEFDYDFKLDKSTKIEVTDTEICGVDLDSYE